MVISPLVIFDLIQVILAGALRGAGDVRAVMWGRFIICFFVFMPLSYFIASLPIENQSIRFALIYASFYLCTGLMGFIFLRRAMGSAWQNKQIN